jgi:hypothetical protein
MGRGGQKTNRRVIEKEGKEEKNCKKYWECLRVSLEHGKRAEISSKFHR